MHKRWVFLVLVFLVPTLGCSSDSTQDEPQDMAVASSSIANDAETATTAVKKMLKLAESGDWDTYVDRYYGEAQKFGSPDERLALVLRFEQHWGSRVLVALRKASQITPVIKEGKALFSDGEKDVFALHKDKNGKWTFHL